MTEKNDIEAIRDFIKKVGRKHAAGGATEHSYRPYLIKLIETLDDKIDALNERKRIACGSPDITMMRDEDIPIGYLEAKDIDKSIRVFNEANQLQFDSYTNSLDNLIYTNCLDWDFYRNGKREYSVSIAELKAGKIIPITKNYAELVIYLQDSLEQNPKTITTADELTEYMAKRTKMIRFSIIKSMDDKDGNKPLEALIKQHKLIDKMLVKDITVPEFANMYAQTITYGLFVAKLQSEANNNPTETFIRQNIPDLLPTTYPFLSKLFSFIASDELKDKLDRPIDALIRLYRSATVQDIMATYGHGTGREDPFLHFYEKFLAAYNPEERERSGVYYTPEPVVNFIVRGVDWVLKNKFNLQGGLANSEKTKIKWKTDRIEGEDYQEELREVHKLQILDPATGTGTFLAQTIRHIAKHVKKSAPANWSSYVDTDLLPRLHGFEFMMAPYAMSYLKLDMVLAELNYTPTKNRPDRMSIYLTNSLSEASKDIANLDFSNWLAEEAQGAADIKNNQPIMCVIGNPPYLAASKNKDPWILKLLEDYKKEPNSGKLLDERNPKWINDDYVKFIRLAQHMVEKNGEGVVGMITNHSYLDNATFRGMRWHLMKSFDEIYILDLQGDITKNKTAPDRKDDKNVFDITKGVSIIIAWKTKQAKGTEKPLAQVFRGDLLGTRRKKFKALHAESLDSDLFQKLAPRAPDYFFKPVDYELKIEYNKSFKITKLFDAPADMMEGEDDLKSQKIKPNKSKNTHNYSVGIVTGGDSFVIAENKTKLHQRLDDFLKTDKSESDIQEYYGLGKNYAKRLFNNKAKLKINEDNFIPIDYRPFDTRVIYSDDLLIERSRKKIMHHFSKYGNLGILVKRQCKQDFSYVFITDKITESCVFESAYANNTVLPLYLYPDDNDLDRTIRINMDPIIRKDIEDAATDSKHGTPDEYAIFDYIYGVLHAPEYRTRYAEFLKEDFPRIPYPKDSAEFWYLSSIGTKLRKLHLMPKDIDISAYTFGGKDITPIVESPYFDNEGNGRVWINKSQFFDNVPESAWDFHIGGYQPAQKWLKDRKGQEIDYEHYQKIIAVLVQTKTTMDEIEWSRP